LARSVPLGGTLLALVAAGVNDAWLDNLAAQIAADVLGGGVIVWLVTTLTLERAGGRDQSL